MAVDIFSDTQKSLIVMKQTVNINFLCDFMSVDMLNNAPIKIPDQRAINRLSDSVLKDIRKKYTQNKKKGEDGEQFLLGTCQH